MTGINSDLGGARLKATALKQATDKLAQTITVTSDTQTTVVGNSTAQEALLLAQDTAKQIAEAVSLAAGNIQSAAEDFEALDHQVGKMLFQPIGGGS